MTIASILSDLWRGGGAFEAPPLLPGPGTPKKPRPNRVKQASTNELATTLVIHFINNLLLGYSFNKSDFEKGPKLQIVKAKHIISKNYVQELYITQ